MKRILGIFLALSVFSTSFAAATATVLPSLGKPSKINAADVLVPIGHTGQNVSLLKLAHMKPKEVETLTGQKMKLTDKIGFRIAQRQLARSINDDGTIDSRKISQLAGKRSDGTGFHLGGFALGFFLGLIGVLIAYLIRDELKKARVKWAWLGFATLVVLELVIVLALV